MSDSYDHSAKIREALAKMGFSPEQLRNTASIDPKIQALEARISELEEKFRKLNRNDKSIIEQVKSLTTSSNRLVDRLDRLIASGGLQGELARRFARLERFRRKFVLGKLKYRAAKRAARA